MTIVETFIQLRDDIRAWVVNNLNIKENIFNKTTEINADSTNDQYPSAKAVWDVTKNAGGAVSSVNGKVGDVVLSANDVEAYSQIPGINITGRGIEIHSNSDKNIILFTHRDDGSFAVHDLSQKADKATTLSEYGIEDAYTKDETNSQIGVAIESTIIYRADRDLSNVSDEAFLDKLNAVLPNGDEVSY